MKSRKIVLDEISRCYCVNHMTVDGILRIVFASEEIDGPCYAYSGKNFEHKEVVWEKGGGTMSFSPIPGSNGEFLAIQNFFPGFNAKDAKIVWGKYKDGRWEVKDFLKLPYVHRFDILESEGKLYFIGTTLCCGKQERNDWSDPGMVWVGELPCDLNEKMDIKPIKDFLLKNHGYCQGYYQDKQVGFITCDSGLYVVIPPDGNSDWEIKQLMADQISDVAVYDLDKNGENEYAVITPFHGNAMEIRKIIDDRRYETIYTYPYEMDFAHAIWAGEIFGTPTVVLGVRRAECELAYIQYNQETNQFETHMIEKGVGTANVSLIHEEDRVLLIAANHTKNEAAVYIITKS